MRYINSNRLYVIYLLCIIITGISLRLMHVWDHYPNNLLGPDSHYFQSLGNRIASGEQVDITGTGLAYPIAYIPHAEYVLPLVIYVLISIVLYAFCNMHFGNRAACCSTAVFSVLPHSVIITGSCNLDRDGAVILLTILAVYLHYRLQPHNREWLPVIVAMCLLVVVWHWSGAVILATIMTCLTYHQLHRRDWVDVINVVIIGALFVLVIWVISNGHALSTLQYYLNPYTGIAEADGAGFAHYLSCYGMLIVIIIYAIMRHGQHSRIMSGITVWFLIFFIGAFFTARLLIHAIIPVCIIIGVFIDRLYTSIDDSDIDYTKKVRITAILSIIIAIFAASTIPQNMHIGELRGMKPPTATVQCLQHARNIMPDDAVLSVDPWLRKWAESITELETHGMQYDGGSDYVILPCGHNVYPYCNEVPYFATSTVEVYHATTGPVCSTGSD